MFQFECSFMVNGRKTVEIVSANSQIDAKKIIEARYAGSTISFWFCKRI